MRWQLRLAACASEHVQQKDSDRHYALEYSRNTYPSVQVVDAKPLQVVVYRSQVLPVKMQTLMTSTKLLNHYSTASVPHERRTYRTSVHCEI